MAKTETASSPSTVRRHGWGRGTIEQRGPKTWLVRLSHRTDPSTGKRIRQARVVQGTRRDAERTLAALVREREAHGPSPTTVGRVTLDAWVRQYLTAADLSERTRADQLRFWSTYSTPQLRGAALRDLTTTALVAFVTTLRERVSQRTGRPLAPRTVALVLNVIKGALSAAVRQRVLPVNPAVGVTVRGGGAVSTAGQALTAAEVERLLAHDPTHRLHALWTVAAYTGVRPGELLALRWEDVDLDDATLHVRRTLVRVDRQMYYAPCKARSARDIPLAAAVVEALRRHRARQLEERLALGDAWVDPRLVFASEAGSALDANNVADLFRARVKATKVQPTRWYDLRHSFGSHLVASGTDIKTVAQLMGHASVVTTMANYVHPNSAAHRSAVTRLPWHEAAAPTG